MASEYISLEVYKENTTQEFMEGDNLFQSFILSYNEELVYKWNE